MGDLLDEILDRENLRQAWKEVAAKKGCAGVDHVTVRRWGRRWEERLEELRTAVRKRQYRPHRLRRFRIRKRRGWGFRRLGVPTVTDRVLQRAVLRVLDDIFEERFLDCSYGYRPGRSLHDAVNTIAELRDDGYVWVLDADIDEFFNNIDLGLLRQFLQVEIADKSLLRLFDLWLAAGCYDCDGGKGIAQGSVVSPLLANIYLHRLDVALSNEGRPIVRYADDFVVFSKTQKDAVENYRLVEEILADLRLRYEPSKTRITSFGEGFEFLGVVFKEDYIQFVWKEKRVKVKGEPRGWPRFSFPEGYS